MFLAKKQGNGAIAIIPKTFILNQWKSVKSVEISVPPVLN